MNDVVTLDAGCFRVGARDNFNVWRWQSLRTTWQIGSGQRTVQLVLSESETTSKDEHWITSVSCGLLALCE